MSTDITQGGYFQQSSHDTKTRSNRKKSYKYTENEFNNEPPSTERYRHHESKLNVHDFSFQDRSQKLRTPKKEVVETQKMEQSLSPITARDSNKKKNFNQRISTIQNLNDKISSLLKMVPKGSERANKIRQTPQETKIKTRLESIRNERTIAVFPNEQTLSSKFEEEKNRRTDERKKSCSYLQESIGSKFDKQPRQVQRKVYIQSKFEDPEREASPITKYRNELKNPNREESSNRDSKQQEKQDSKSIEPEISQTVLKVNHLTNRQFNENKAKYSNPSSLLEKYRQNKNQEIYTYIKKEKENDFSVKRSQYLLRNAQVDRKINQNKNLIVEQSPRRLKNYNDALKLQQQFRIEQAYRDSGRNNEKSTISLLARKLCLLIDLDIIQRKIRQSFDQHRNQKKWELLRAQLKSQGIYLDEKELKEIIKISIHEKNPFGDKIQAFPLNGAKDLAKLFAQTERIWKEQLEKFISLDDLARQQFQMGLIDINRKGYIIIEDLVCFVNVQGQRFYRNRDLAQLFKRFLSIQGKNFDTNISDGIEYRTFMGKVCK